MAGLLVGAAVDAAEYPATPKHPVVDTMHGVAISDPYRWLEGDGAEEVKAWTIEQNALTREVLDAVPQRADVSRRVAALLGQKTVSRYDFVLRHGQVFAMKNEPPNNQPMLVLLPESLDVAQERVILDPAALDPSGRTTIDFFKPSYDGRYVALSLSKGGSEEGTAYVYDVSTGKALSDTIERVMFPTAGGSIEWATDSSGFFYTRYPAPSERADEDRQFYQTIWYHRLGTSMADDVYVLGREFPRIAEVALIGSDDGRDLLAEVRNGDGGEIAYYLRAASGQWTQVAGFADGVKQMDFGGDGRLYALSIKGALLGRVLAMPLDAPALARASVVVPADKLAIERISAGRSRLYVQYRDGGPSVVRIFSQAGKRLGDLPAEPIADVSVDEVLGDDVIVRVMSYRTPATRYRYVAARGELVATALNGKPDFNFDDAVVERMFATSKDGTRVPLTILRRRDAKMDGNLPVILYGYGGYGISMVPYFSALNRLWLDYGGAFAVAGIRGGGEYGEPWHRAGMLTRKQNVFDDFAACMEYLADHKITRPARLAIMGGSNGGLTMGAALTQHPNAMRAVVSYVGIYDALRWETQANGAFNVTEFGSVKDPAQFRALHSYSPLLHVKDGVAYPAVLLLTGENDGRVAPYESRKLAARLQAATASKRPVLLRSDADAGHGIGTALSGRMEEEADVYTFLVDQLGMPEPTTDSLAAH